MMILSFVMQLFQAPRMRRDESGASLVEYALLLALIAIVAIVALSFLGGSVSNTLNTVGGSINNP
jgi:pilus assembly protein Flp/PilA